jgi:hypothetical protein
MRRPRSAKQVRARARALAALVRHAQGEPQDPASLALTPGELDLLASPAALWPEQDVVDATWRGEALGMLIWALGVVRDLPPYDRPFDHAALARTPGLDDAELRPRAELADAREAARLWHWRARTAVVRDEHLAGVSGTWQSFDQLIAATAMKGHARGLLPLPLRGDFPAFGKPYRSLAHEERALAHSIAAERHYALAWLCSSGVEWHDVKTDT